MSQKFYRGHIPFSIWVRKSKDAQCHAENTSSTEKVIFFKFIDVASDKAEAFSERLTLTCLALVGIREFAQQPVGAGNSLPATTTDHSAQIVVHPLSNWKIKKCHPFLT